MFDEMGLLSVGNMLSRFVISVRYSSALLICKVSYLCQHVWLSYELKENCHLFPDVED